MSTTAARTAPAAAGRRRRRLAIPPQHGAWAYLAVPLVLGLVLAPSWSGALFAATWVLAYPASYYLGRALVIRWRRGSWSRLARRELRDGVPWAIAAAAGALALAVLQPWLVAAAGVLALAWAVGLVLAHAGRERGFANDLLLIAQALVALPMLWWVAAASPPWTEWPPAAVWLATGVTGVYFVGSVIHVKSLIREADDRRWRIADVAYHVAALSLGLLSPWLLVPFAAALVRAVALRPGTPAARIGAVEAVVSVLVVGAVLLAVG